jgi:hypothetical protein
MTVDELVNIVSLCIGILLVLLGIGVVGLFYLMIYQQIKELFKK